MQVRAHCAAEFGGPELRTGLTDGSSRCKRQHLALQLKTCRHSALEEMREQCGSTAR